MASFGRNLDKDASLAFSFWTSWTLVGFCISSMEVHLSMLASILSVERLPPAIEEREKFDLIEERPRAIEGIGDYPFADMA